MGSAELSAAKRLPIVGVIGSGREEHAELSSGLGRCLAKLGVHLLTGGGGGVMAAVSRAFCEIQARDGRSIGILPSNMNDPLCRTKPGYPNNWVEIPIATHLPFSGKAGDHSLSRNHIVVLSSDALIALPGGEGTLSEMRLALQYGRPLLAYGVKAEWVTQPPGPSPTAKSLSEVETFLNGVLRLG